MRVLLDTRPGTTHTGIGRYARTLREVLAPGLQGYEVILEPALLSFATPREEELALPARLEREGIEVFHSPLFHLPALLPARAVITLHDAVPAAAPELATPAFAALWPEAVEAAARADAVVVPSEAARRDVLAALALPAGKVHVVPETVAATFRETSAAEQAAARVRYGLGAEPFLLLLGALERRKDPATLLDALARRSDLPRAVFVGPPGAIDVAAEAARRGVAGRVRVLGALPDAELVPLLGAAAALCFPSLAEGFGLPVLEAFATGTPVVASTAGALPEVAGDAALLVPPRDASALADALERVTREPALAAELRARGRARLQRFSPEALRAALARVYDGLARRERAA